jgi:hypothetical protein
MPVALEEGIGGQPSELGRIGRRRVDLEELVVGVIDRSSPPPVGIEISFRKFAAGSGGDAAEARSAIPASSAKSAIDTPTLAAARRNLM